MTYTKTVQTNDFSHELIARFKEFPKYSTENKTPSEAEFLHFVNLLKEHILGKDPRLFLEWDLIYTLFIGNAGYTSEELDHLTSRPDWETRWKDALKDSFTGNPAPYPLFPSSTGNLIHNAYHLSRFEEETETEIRDLNFVFELGGGYGSMCRAFQNLGFQGRYLIYDFPPLCALQEYYLKTHDFPVKSSADDFLDSETGILCISDQNMLNEILNSCKKTEGRMFIATCPVYESVARRETVLPLISDFELFLIAFHDKFGKVNNQLFFSEWKEGMTNTDWHSLQLKHALGHKYFTGKKIKEEQDQKTAELLKKGEEAFSSGDLFGADKIYSKILAVYPRHVEALNNTGVIAYMQSDFIRAISFFKKALEIDPLSMDAVENYPKCLIETGNYEEAISFINESINKGFVNTELLNAMGRCFIELGDLKAAQTVFQKSLAMDGDQQETSALLEKIADAANIDSDNPSNINVICFPKNAILGGYGDRIVGLIAVKLISKLLNRKFYIFWEKENIKPYINYEDYDFEKISLNSKDIKAYNLIDNQKLIKDYLINTDAPFPDSINLFYLNQEISQYLYSNKCFSNNDYLADIQHEYNILYKQTLKPSELLKNKINKLIDGRQNIIGIQVRCGDCYMVTNRGERHNTGIYEEIKQEKLFEKIKNYCDSNYDTYSIFFTSDNSLVYEELKKVFDENAIIYNDDIIQHLDRDNVDDDISKVFIDNIILSQYSKALFITRQSNYGRIAALSCDHDNIFHIDSTPLIKKELLSKDEILF